MQQEATSSVTGKGSLSQHSIIVTGGTRGLGAVISKHLHISGHKVAATYVKDHKIAQDFEEETGIAAFSFDISDLSSCEYAIDAIKEKNGPCSTLINNAGINLDGTIQSLSGVEWQAVIDTNLGGCFNMSKLVWQDMKSSGFGRLIHIGSVVGELSGIGISNYIASKAGIEGLSRALATEGARYGITSNVISPGYIDVGMGKKLPEKLVQKIKNQIPMRRFGMPNEIVHAVSFLMDQRSGYITGTTLPINGGLSFN